MTSLATFEFEVVPVNPQGLAVEWLRYKGRAEYYREELGNDVSLDLVAIPAGTFLMGASSKEEEGIHWPFSDYQNPCRYERPQHEVAVRAFFMAKYPITQAQWKKVAKLPQIAQELPSNPSHFKGDDLPVEGITCYDAIEFCARLSQNTEHKYRLPSEAEWEYACRAGTTTPYHCGETIVTDLANFRPSFPYGYGPRERWDRSHNQTTDVGVFPPNAFGLYDMHGNVWEWCLDSFHEFYIGAPTDGTPWISRRGNSRMLRGGSWHCDTHRCRSAARLAVIHKRSPIKLGLSLESLEPSVLGNVLEYEVGFRVVFTS